MTRARAGLAALSLAVAVATAAPARAAAGSPASESHAGETVFLVHGLGNHGTSMRFLEEDLTARGYTVRTLDLPTEAESIEALARRLREAVAEVPRRERIHFVTHSMGGLVLRCYLAGRHRSRIGRVVMLAPPNGGSELADLLNRLPLVRRLAAPACGQLGTHSRLGWRWPRRTDLGIIAGDRSPRPVSRLLIRGPDDGVVSVHSTELQGMRDFLTVHRSHGTILRAPEVLEETAWFLDHGEFRDGERAERVTHSSPSSDSRPGP